MNNSDTFWQKNRYSILFLLALSLIACIIIFAARSIIDKPRPLAAQPMIQFPTPYPVITETNKLFLPVITHSQPTPTPPVPVTSPFTTNEWHVQECTNDQPLRCSFIQPSNSVAYWGECIDPPLDQPQSYDWYVLQEDVFYPRDNQNLQRFQMLPEEGQGK